MCHANTPFHNKEVILKSWRSCISSIRCCCSWNECQSRWVFHYGAPASIDDYFQESRRAGRSREAAKSTVYWKPSDVLLQKDTSDARYMELIAMCHYLENNTKCRNVGGNFWTILILICLVLYVEMIDSRVVKGCSYRKCCYWILIVTCTFNFLKYYLLLNKSVASLSDEVPLPDRWCCFCLCKIHPVILAPDKGFLLKFLKLESLLPAK